MSGTYLLGADAIIALVIADHEHHDRAASWAAGVAKIALCPIVEGALIRFVLRAGESSVTATTLLTGLHASSRTEFWPDSISYAATDLGHVVGHRQVTDAYLAALAARHDCRLATFDRALADGLPEHTHLIA